MVSHPDLPLWHVVKYRAITAESNSCKRDNSEISFGGLSHFHNSAIQVNMTFSSIALDLNPMTFILKLNPDMVKMYPCTKI